MTSPDEALLSLSSPELKRSPAHEILDPSNSRQQLLAGRVPRVTCWQTGKPPEPPRPSQLPPPAMAPEPRMKRKSSPASGSSQLGALPASWIGLLSQLDTLATALSSAEPEPALLLTRLKSMHAALRSFQRALEDFPSQHSASTLPPAYQETLDREGVLLWNRSTAIRCSVGSQGYVAREGDGEWKMAVAERA